MKVRSLFFVLVAFATFSCSPLKKLPGLEDQAKTAIENDNYWQAYDYLNQYIDICKSSGTDVDVSVVQQMAAVCTELNKVGEAASYYEELLGHSEHQHLITTYATLLQSNDENQKEFDVWKRYAPKLNTPELRSTAFNRQIILAVLMEKNEDALTLWKEKPGEVEVSADAYFAYVNAAEKTGNTKLALKGSSELIKRYPEFVPGLEWRAKYFYDKAEKRYQSAMKKYNKKKTATTYAYLRRDLKKISADFRISKKVFEKLRELNPEGGSYVKYLKNIYLRLDMKSEAAKMDKLIK